MKVGAIIQARMGSSRLPGKILLPLPSPDGPSILQHIVNRAKQVPNIDQVIVATSTNIENDILTKELLGVEVFRGSEDDVLERFSLVAQKYNFDVVVRLTADNPFIDCEILQDVIGQHVESGADYTKTQGLPLGMNIEVISVVGLLRAQAQATLVTDREHVTSFIRNGKEFKKNSIHFSDQRFAKWRMTIDYESDYDFAKTIFDYCYEKDNFFGLVTISGLISRQPQLLEINGNNSQRHA